MAASHDEAGEELFPTGTVNGYTQVFNHLLVEPPQGIETEEPKRTTLLGKWFGARPDPEPPAPRPAGAGPVFPPMEAVRKVNAKSNFTQAFEEKKNQLRLRRGDHAAHSSSTSSSSSSSGELSGGRQREAMGGATTAAEQGAVQSAEMEGPLLASLEKGAAENNGESQPAVRIRKKSQVELEIVEVAEVGGNGGDASRESSTSRPEYATSVQGGAGEEKSVQGHAKQVTESGSADEGKSEQVVRVWLEGDGEGELRAGERGGQLQPAWPTVGSGNYTQEFKRVAAGGGMPSFRVAQAEQAEMHTDWGQGNHFQPTAHFSPRTEGSEEGRFVRRTVGMGGGAEAVPFPLVSLAEHRSKPGNFTMSFEKVVGGGSMPQFPGAANSQMPSKQRVSTLPASQFKKGPLPVLDDGFTEAFNVGIPTFPKPRPKQRAKGNCLWPCFSKA